MKISTTPQNEWNYTKEKLNFVEKGMKLQKIKEIRYSKNKERMEFQRKKKNIQQKKERKKERKKF